ncbi:hypothetical protein RCL1_003302 [Eukaryota sp. TZLM3-RCL]
MDRETLATVYASLLIHDEGVAVTSDKIEKVLAAANIKVEPYLPPMFARALEGVQIADLIKGASAAGVAPAAAAGVAATETTAAAPEKEEVKEEVVEEEVGSFDLFGDDDW